MVVRRRGGVAPLLRRALAIAARLHAINGNKSMEHRDGTLSNALLSNRGLWYFCLHPSIFSLVSSMFFTK